MCGIAGFLTLQPTSDAVAGLTRALACLTHRGPDDCGMLTFPPTPGRGPLTGLGNRRLRIIDTTSAGHQPMTTADGRYSITYNGEIYNAPELRAELEASGRRFVSRCDTEVLLQAWAAWGRSCLDRLEGMFAFALLDRVDRKLVLARDAFGIKPLYYSRSPSRLVFASEIAAVLAFGGIGPRINPTALRRYLLEAHTGIGSDTLLAEVRQVPPAHWLDMSLDMLDGAEPTRYWSPDGGTRNTVSIETAAGELRTLVLDSVRLHLRSDVPVGFSLSGGVDSSALLLASRHALGRETELHAFGFVADEPGINESAWQERAATAAGASLHPVHVHSAELERDLDRMVAIQGEPFGSPTIYAQYRVFEQARKTGIKVMLGGQGADELFAGYHTFLPARAASLLMAGRWVSAAKFVTASAARWGLARRPLARGAVGLALPAPLEQVIRRALERGRRGGVTGWLNEGWLARQGAVVPPRWRPDGRDAMRRLLVHSVENAHLQALMRYEDRSAMSLSMENRVPLLTSRLARFAFSLPESYLVRQTGEGKAVLRAAMRGIVPDGILDRRNRIGFGVPVVRWLMELSPMVDRKLALLGGCPAINSTAIRWHWAALRRGTSPGSASAIWRCITLATWAEHLAVSWA